MIEYHDRNIKDMVNIKDHLYLLQKVKEIDQDKITDLKNQLTGKLQELDLMVSHLHVYY